MPHVLAYIHVDTRSVSTCPPYNSHPPSVITSSCLSATWDLRHSHQILHMTWHSFQCGILTFSSVIVTFSARGKIILAISRHCIRIALQCFFCTVIHFRSQISQGTYVFFVIHYYKQPYWSSRNDIVSLNQCKGQRTSHLLQVCLNLLKSANWRGI